MANKLGIVIGILEIIVGIVLLAYGNAYGVGLIISGVLSIAAALLMPDVTEASDEKASQSWGYNQYANPIKGDTPVYITYSYAGVKLAPVWTQAFVTPTGNQDTESGKILRSQGQALSGMLVFGEGPCLGLLSLQINDEDVWTTFTNVGSNEAANGTRKIFTFPHAQVDINSVSISTVLASNPTVATALGWVNVLGADLLTTGDGTTSIFSFTIPDTIVDSAPIKFYTVNPNRADKFNYEILDTADIYPRVWMATPTRLLVNTQTPYPLGRELWIEYTKRSKSAGLTAIRKSSGGFIEIQFQTAPLTGTTVQATYNRNNFIGFTYQFRPGSRHQLPVRGFDNIRQSYAVGQQVPNNSTGIIQTTKDTVDNIILSLDSGTNGFTQFDAAGGHGPVSALLKISLKLDATTPIAGNVFNGQFVQLIDPQGARPAFISFTPPWPPNSLPILVPNPNTLPKAANEFEIFGDKLTQQFNSFNLGKIIEHYAEANPTDPAAQTMLKDFVRARYQIKVIRSNPIQQNFNNRIADSIVWSTWLEEVNENLNYANSCAIFFHGVASSKLNGSVPNITATLRGIATVERATNEQLYLNQPVPRWTTAGASVDGGAEGSNQSNPVWAAVDLLTHKRYGCGDVYTKAVNIDVQSAIVAANWCDELVRKEKTSPSTDTEKRMLLDITLDTRKSPMEHLRAMLLPHRIWLIHRGDYVFFEVDDVVTLFNTDGTNAVPVLYDDTPLGTTAMNSLNLSRGSIADRPTEVQCLYLDRNKKFEQKEVWVTTEQVPTTPRRIQRATAYGIMRITEVTRYALYLHSQARSRLPSLVVGADPRFLNFGAASVFRVISQRAQIDGYWRVRKTSFNTNDFFSRIEAVPYDPSAYSLGNSTPSIILPKDKQSAGVSSAKSSGGVATLMTVSGQRIS